jgi:hypothetical protein
MEHYENWLSEFNASLVWFVAKVVFYQRIGQGSKTIKMCSVNVFARMQIQWIHSGNQAFGITIEFLRGDLRQRESDREVISFSPPHFSLSVSERLSRCGVNALRDIEHLGLLVEKKKLAARLLVQFSSLKSLVAEHFQENDLMVRDSKEEFADYVDGDGFYRLISQLVITVFSWLTVCKTRKRNKG